MEAKWHNHPMTGVPVFGTLIESGTRLEENDVYDSTNGKWEECPCPGIILQTDGTHVIWVRPCLTPKDFSIYKPKE